MTQGKAVIKDCVSSLALGDDVAREHFDRLVKEGMLARKGRSFVLSSSWVRPTHSSATAIADDNWQGNSTFPPEVDGASRRKDTATAPTSATTTRAVDPPAAPRKKKPSEESQSLRSGLKQRAPQATKPLNLPPASTEPSVFGRSQRGHNRVVTLEQGTEETKLDESEPMESIEDIPDTERMIEQEDEDEETQLEEAKPRAPAKAPVAPAPAPAAVGKRRGREESCASNESQSHSSDDDKKRHASTKTVVSRMPPLDLQVRKPGSAATAAAARASTQQQASDLTVVNLKGQSQAYDDTVMGGGPSYSQESELSLHGTARYAIIEKPIYQKKKASQQ